MTQYETKEASIAEVGRQQLADRCQRLLAIEIELNFVWATVLAFELPLVIVTDCVINTRFKKNVPTGKFFVSHYWTGIVSGHIVV